MVDELGPDRLTACSGSIDRTGLGFGGSAIDSVALQPQLGGAVVPRDPVKTLNGGGCCGDFFTASGEGSGVGESRQIYCRDSPRSEANRRPPGRGRRRWNSGCSMTRWIVAPRPRPRRQPVTVVQTGGLNPQAEDTTATARAAAELEESACWQQEARHWQHKYEEEQQAHISSHKLVVALRQQSEEATADAVLAEQEAAAELVSAEKSARDWQRKHCAALQQLEAARAELATATSAVAEEGEQQYHAAQNQLEAAWREVRRAQAENEKLQHAPERVGMGDEDLRSTCVRQQCQVSSRLEATQERQQEAARKKTVASRADSLDIDIYDERATPASII